MKKNLLLIIFLFCSLFIFNLSVYAVEAKVTELPGYNSGGKVAVKKTSNSPFTKAEVNDIIKQNGVICTGKGNTSIAELIISSDKGQAIVRLGSSSYLKLNPSDEKVKILLDNGKVLVQSKSNMNLNVYVGNYVAASEGTTFTVNLTGRENNDGDEVEIEVYEGKVNFINQEKPNEVIQSILPGEKLKLRLKIKEFIREKRLKRRERIKHFLDKISFNDHNLLENIPEPEITQDKLKDIYETPTPQMEKFTINTDKPLFKNFKSGLFKDKMAIIMENRKLQRERRLERRNKFRKNIKQKLGITEDNKEPNKSNNPENNELHKNSSGTNFHPRQRRGFIGRRRLKRKQKIQQIMTKENLQEGKETKK